MNYESKNIVHRKKFTADNKPDSQTMSASPDASCTTDTVVGPFFIGDL